MRGKHSHSADNSCTARCGQTGHVMSNGGPGAETGAGRRRCVHSLARSRVWTRDGCTQQPHARQSAGTVPVPRVHAACGRRVWNGRVQVRVDAENVKTKHARQTWLPWTSGRAAVCRRDRGRGSSSGHGAVGCYTDTWLCRGWETDETELLRVYFFLVHSFKPFDQQLFYYTSTFLSHKIDAITHTKKRCPLMILGLFYIII